MICMMISCDQVEPRENMKLSPRPPEEANRENINTDECWLINIKVDLNIKSEF